jgi:tRNA-binding EMAP/Myf-like protein
MERKLASIRTITDIQPIPNADSIEVVSIGGWKVVSKKGEYNVGDMCVYCEIDSFLPVLPQYEFLRKSSYKKMSDGTEGFRLKTIKLRGQVSQGLVLPISILPEGKTLFEGMDVTDVLSITKYEPPIPASLSGQVKGHFPSFLQKTDEERCLSFETLIETEDGLKTIGEICESQYIGNILSHNVITGIDEMNPIFSHSIQENNDDWFEIELESGKTIKATGNHKIWLPELLCYREIKHLNGDEIVKITD